MTVEIGTSQKFDRKLEAMNASPEKRQEISKTILQRHLKKQRVKRERNAKQTLKSKQKRSILIERNKITGYDARDNENDVGYEEDYYNEWDIPFLSEYNEEYYVLF